MRGYFPDKVFEGHPKAGYVLVHRKVMRGEQMTAGGIVLPANADEKAQPTCLGTVIRVGEGVKNLSPGDRVVFSPWPVRGVTIMVGRGADAHMFMHEDDIFGKYDLRDATDEDRERWQKELDAQQRIATPAPPKILRP